MHVPDGAPVAFLIKSPPNDDQTAIALIVVVASN